MKPYEYAVLRVVPRVDRGEFLNAGVLLYCRDLDYLGGAVHLDVERLRALAPAAEPTAILAALQAAADGPAPDGIGARFRWLAAPRSTVVQPGPVHTGLTTDPRAELARLLHTLVEQP